nr:tyrosine-type recombinase/integrase [Blastococcus sp. CT_GayMR20]
MRSGSPATSPPSWPERARRWGRSGCRRHTHATLLLADGVPVKVVSERLGHASATITLTVYQRVRPGMGREAAERFAALLDG